MTRGPIPDPEIPSAITDAPQAAAMQPDEADEQMKRTTHEVDADDMFTPTAL